MNTAEITARLGLCLPRLAPRLRPSARISELELDIMDTVELLCVIHEEFGVRLTEDEFRPDQTVDGLLATITKSCPSEGSAARCANVGGSS
jgi:acyl carrier protein